MMKSRILYFAVFITGSGLGLVKMLAVAGELAPASFGAYSLAVIAAALLGYVNSFGVFDAFLVRLNPGQSAHPDRRVVRDSGILFSVAMSLIMSTIAVVTYLAFNAAAYGTAFVVTVIVFLIAQNLFNVLMVEIQAEARSTTYAILLTVKSLVPIVVILAVRPGDDLLFFLALDAVCLIALAIYCMTRTGLPSPANFSSRQVMSLMRQGAPFTGQNAVQNLATNADKWAIGIGLGSAQVGIYNLAAQLVVCGVAFASMIQIYFLPQVMRASLEQETPIMLLRRVLKISLFALSVAIVMFTGGAILAYPIILWYYPDYAPAVTILPIAALAGVIISSNHTDLYFRARLLGSTYLAVQIFTLVTLVILFAFLIRAGGVLWMYAAIFAGTRVLQTLVSYGAVYRDARRSEQAVAT